MATFAQPSARPWPTRKHIESVLTGRGRKLGGVTFRRQWAEQILHSHEINAIDEILRHNCDANMNKRETVEIILENWPGRSLALKSRHSG